MKKIFGFIMMVVFMFSLSTVYATEKTPTFTKKDAIIFYEVPDQILMCQNKQEDMIKGAIEFEKTLKKYYQKRFNVISLQRTYIVPAEDGKYLADEKKKLFDIAQGALPVIVKIDLLGNSTATDTYQNMFGAKKSITVPTTTIEYCEQIGDDAVQTFWYWKKKADYRPETFSIFGDVFAADADARKLTKICVESFIRDVNMFNPPNKYTYPEIYSRYWAFYSGDAKMLTAMNQK